jgi:hypothetical protein
MKVKPMPNRAASSTLQAKSCTDPIVGAILSGWRYDISSISPEMRTDYEQHLAECPHCRRRQSIARTIDVLLISVSSLSIIAFLLAAVVIHRLELLSHHMDVLAHYSVVHFHLHQTAIAISLQAIAIAGLLVSVVLWMLVAIATPLPGFLSSVVQQRVPPAIRQRFTRRHA